jgi:hypothetical protein
LNDGFALAKITLLGFCAVLPMTGAGRSKKRVHIPKFDHVVKAVSRAKSFRIVWSNGEETADMQISCPDRMAKTTFNDVSMRSATVSISNDSWQSLSGISGPWVRRENPPSQPLCGRSGLVFPSELDLKSAVRGKVMTSTQGNCEQWVVRTKRKDSQTKYTYCIGANRLPLYWTNDGDSNMYTFSDWNAPIKIEPPKDGEPPCCPPMR